VQRIAQLVWKYRFVLLALWIVHAFVIHFMFVGFMSWDGFGHRGFPIVELFQHGDMNKWKFNEWSLKGYTPFIELAHLPFLLAFGMRGFIIGFPLVVFPLCIYAVYLLVRELAGGDRRAAFFGALAYAAIPMINQQPFTNYVDFAVVGLLAFWLYAVVCLRRDESTRRKLVRLAAATVLFSLGRSQAFYMMIIMFPLIMYGAFGERDGLRIRVRELRFVVISSVVLVLACIPTIAMQVYKYLEYGSPIAPMELKLFGIKIGSGVPLETYFRYAGLGGTDIRSLARGIYDGWIYHLEWPMPVFYGSRYFAAGFLFLLALVLLPFYWRRASSVERWILASGLLVSLLSKDIAVPRTSYTTVVALAIVIGRAIPLLSDWRPWLARIVTAVVLVHLLRPEIDLLLLRQPIPISARMNITGSHHYIRGGWTIPVYADKSRKFVIVEQTANAFVLEVYGKRLTNQILGTVRETELGTRCAGLAYWTLTEPEALYIDDQNKTKDCPRTCAVPNPGGGCEAWKIRVP
jgi:hypothetical protein